MTFSHAEKAAEGTAGFSRCKCIGRHAGFFRRLFGRAEEGCKIRGALALEE
jgi:hypothetical protein